jgi:hypothetical protein
VRLDDRVEFWEGNEGAVVRSIGTQELSEAYPESQWLYLKRGILVATEQAGLMHLTEPPESWRLIRRG